ncbi:pre-mRNA-splicing factor CWC22 homolog [Condylostylus longicornis]|uniref:pre-mRNA-splicing factor CWC22 homolog n=1 Tax=Condylostylus longicornis TaxID=2530218 RepID=UPI00244E1CF7|nr:pre-mRNA-splicing factor CWC22 homolog [Condylostylus longicornis]
MESPRRRDSFSTRRRDDERRLEDFPRRSELESDHQDRYRRSADQEGRNLRPKRNEEQDVSMESEDVGRLESSRDHRTSERSSRSGRQRSLSQDGRRGSRSRDGRQRSRSRDRRLRRRQRSRSINERRPTSQLNGQTGKGRSESEEEEGQIDQK